MKKIFLIPFFLFTFLALFSISDIKVNAEESQGFLTDDMLELLTGEDFNKVNTILESEGYYNGDYTEEELNIVTVTKLKEILEEKATLPKKGMSSKAVSDYLPDAYNKLNSQEKVLAAKDPTQAVVFYAASTAAANKASSLYISSVLHNGNGDAFRHSYWNALLTKKFAILRQTTNMSTGAAIAKTWTDAHEYGATGQPYLEEYMDIKNNKIGRDTAVTKTVYTSDASLATAIVSKVDAGLLYRLVNNVLTTTTSSGKK